MGRRSRVWSPMVRRWTKLKSKVTEWKQASLPQMGDVLHRQYEYVMREQYDKMRVRAISAEVRLEEGLVAHHEAQG